MPSVQNINFACTDPEELAAFWAAALDGERVDLPPEIDPAVVDLPHDGPGLMFRETPKGTERDLPIHLDLSVEDREDAVEQLADLGASVRETKSETTGGETYVWTEMEDPEGNGFCVTEH